MTPCYPATPGVDCGRCKRFLPGDPPPAVPMQKEVSRNEWTLLVKQGLFRVSEVIDASTILWPLNKCPMLEI